MASKKTSKSKQIPFDATRYINPSQVGGIDAYTIDEGPGRGVRVLCVNTGAGLRYRVLVDRGLDIDQAFYNQHSLTCLSLKGVTPPTEALSRGADWLKGFPVGLLTSCGPFNTGAPATDAGEALGLHGPHSNTAAYVESVVQPDPRNGKLDMSVTAVLRYGAFFGPCVELRRTIRSTLGSNRIVFEDEFFNAGNTPVPHAWLLHINLGWPLLDEGVELCWDAERVDPRPDALSQEWFLGGRDYKRIPAPLDLHAGAGEAFAYIYPKPAKNGAVRVGVVNRALKMGFAVDYSAKQFPRCGCWQHWGKHEYVAALEPMNGGVEGRDKDRARGWLDTLKAGAKKRYDYAMEVVTGEQEIDALLALNA